MKKGFFKSGLFYVIVFLAVIGIASWATSGGQDQASEGVSTSEFVEFLEDDRVEEFQVQPTAGVYEVRGRFREGQEIEIEQNQNVTIFGGMDQQEADLFVTYVLRNDSVVNEIYTLARENDVNIVSIEEPTTGIWTSLLFSFLPLILLIGFFYFIMGQAGQGGGSGGGRGVMNFGKSKAKESDAKKSKVRFSDVAGADEEKEELVEIVEFLKNPKKFTDMGARIPKGVLLVGQPGTGKTLLAKAVAGEAGVPFYIISGSDFVEMFVGVGA